MWIVAKINNKKYSMLKMDFLKKNSNIKFYKPVIAKEFFFKNKIFKKPVELFGDYIFCYDKSFEDPKKLQELKFSRGLKYFLTDYIFAQKQITKIIETCRKNETVKGFIDAKFITNLKENNLKFLTGPFRNIICEILNVSKRKVEFNFGNFRAVTKNNNLI